MERVTWKLTLPYTKQRANANLLNDSGNSQGLSNNLQGWDTEEDGQEGTYAYLWLIHIGIWPKTTSSVKPLSFN